MYIRSFKLLLILLILSPAQLFTQSNNIEEHVLKIQTSAEVTAATDDAEGNLWIATSNFSLADKPQFYPPRILRVGRDGSIVDDYTIDVSAGQESREGAYSIIGLLVDSDKIRALVFYGTRDLWWINIDRKTRKPVSHKFTVSPAHALAGVKALLIPAANAALVYGNDRSMSAIMYIRDTGELVWSTQIDNKRSGFVDGLIIDKSSFVLLKHDLNMSTKAIESTMVFVDSTGKILRQQVLNGNTSSLYLDRSGDIVASTQEERAVDIIRIAPAQIAGKREIPLIVASPNIVNITESSVSLVGFEHQRLTYWKISNSAEVLEKQTIQKDEGQILSMRTKRIGNMIYILGAVYIRDGGVFIQKIKIISFKE